MSTLGTTAASRAAIARYFDTCEGDYRRLWDLDASLAMHIGCWDETTPTLRAALARQNQIMAEGIGVRAGDRVLDAGCGVGGSAIFLADCHGCDVVGVTLSQRQAAAARGAARARAVAPHAAFARMDYMQTGFRDGSFDVVWAAESVCYAPDKRAFLREARRILRPGGRLVLADGFTIPAGYRRREYRMLRAWLDGWAVPHLETVEGFHAALTASGFRVLRFDDVTAAVLPSTRRLYWHSLYGLPLSRVGELLGVREPLQTRNARAARYAYLLAKRGLVRYGIFYAIAA